MTPCFLTVVVPIRPGQEAAVLAKVRTMANPTTGVSAAIAALHIVHFMSLSVIDPDGGAPANLIMEASVDGTASAALKKLAAGLKTWLDDLLTLAGIAPLGRRDLAGCLGRHSHVLGASWASTCSLQGALGLPFCGSPGMTLGRILAERDLAARIAGMATLLRGPDRAWNKLQAVRQALWQAGDAKWAFAPLNAPFLGPARPRGSLVTAQILLAAFPALLWPLGAVPLLTGLLAWSFGWPSPVTFGLWAVPLTLALAAGSAFLRLRREEANDTPEDRAPNPDKVRAVMDKENQHQLNLLIAVTPIKCGWFRRLTLRGALWVTGQALARSGRAGFLGDVGVVQYARWLLLPGTRQVVFLSNYDGSWESYLEDFVNLVPYGPTAIWSNCLGFPRTRLLFGAGAADGDRFRRWVRRHQIPTAFWYAAYPDLPLGRIRTNAAIRKGIAAARTDTEARAWLALFGAASP